MADPVLSLVDDADGKFSLAGKQLTVAAALDYETAASHQIIVRATDADGWAKDKALTIRVTDVSGDIVYYVDSVSGSDSNNGLTAGTAFQTFAKVVSLAGAGARINLSRGSYWREQLNIPANGVSVQCYGAGAMPVIDGADIVTTGWTQPDSVTYPNVWSRSWSRASATTTGEEKLGYWQAGSRTTHRADLTALQAGSNGDWHTTDLTAKDSTVSIRANADPNSDGILREITKRHYGINGHTTTLLATREATIVGPIEIKRCVGHYNALPKGHGPASLLFLRDGNIHDAVSESNLLADILVTEYSPETAPSALVAYTSDGSTFNPVFRRCGVLMPGGNLRVPSSNASAFYAHDSTGGVQSSTVDACFTRGINFGSATAGTFTVQRSYIEDVYDTGLSVNTPDVALSHILFRDSAVSPVSGSFYAIFRGTNAVNVSLQHLAFHQRKGFPFYNDPPVGDFDMRHCAFMSSAGSFVGIQYGAGHVEYSVLYGAGRSMSDLGAAYTGDFNVHFFVGQDAAWIHWNGNLYTSLAAFQAASGQDTNSVYLKIADQASGNAGAFWLGVSSGLNDGPPDGDFRVNPNAKVYNAAGTSLIGVFADGVTPITLAGPQEYWDFNTRAISAGAPPRNPTLPVSIAEMRAYLGDPTAWDFYP